MSELITLEEYRTYKNITNPDKDDRIRYIVAAVNALVKHYCNRKFVEHYADNNLIQYFDGTTSTAVYLDEFPVVNVVAVNVSTDGGVTNTLLTEDTDYFVDTEDGYVETATGSNFTRGTRIKHHSLKVEYAGGFEVAPDDLKIACLDLVDYYKNEDYIPEKSMGRAGEITQFVTKSLPPHIKRVMDLYRIIY